MVKEEIDKEFWTKAIVFGIMMAFVFRLVFNAIGVLFGFDGNEFVESNPQMWLGFFVSGLLSSSWMLAEYDMS